MTPTEYAEAMRFAECVVATGHRGTQVDLLARALLLHRWRPIEEAPRWAESPVLLYHPSDPMVRQYRKIGYWYDGQWFAAGQPVAYNSPLTGTRQGEPTHYSELPPPPEVTK